MSRNFTSKNHPSLVAVLHQCVKRAPNGLTPYEIAEIVYPDSSSAYNTMMAELTQGDRKFDADRVLAIVDATDSDAPIYFLARERGGAFVKLPDPALCKDAALFQTLAASVREFGEFAAEAANDISDGDIPRDQLDRINKEADEAVEAIVAMKKLALATHEKQYGGGK